MDNLLINLPIITEKSIYEHLKRTRDISGNSRFQLCAFQALSGGRL